MAKSSEVQKCQVQNSFCRYMSKWTKMPIKLFKSPIFKYTFYFSFAYAAFNLSVIILNLYKLLMHRSESNENLNIQVFKIFNIELEISPRIIDIFINAINFATFAELLCDIWEGNLIGLQNYVCINLLTVIISLGSLVILLRQIRDDRNQMIHEVMVWTFMLLNWISLFAYVNTNAKHLKVR